MKKLLNKLKLTASALAILFVLISAATPMSISAVEPPAKNEYITLVPLPGTTDCGEMTNIKDCKTNLQTYLPGMFKLFVGIVAGIAFVALVYGGLQYATYDAIYAKEEGKKTITNALTGLFLALISYTILYTINPNSLNLTLNIDSPKINVRPDDVLKVAPGGNYTNNKPFDINGYNIAPYATATWHETTVKQIYQTEVNTVKMDASSIDKYIQGKFPGAKVTGEMILGASQKAGGVDPKLMMAIMQTDSHFGAPEKDPKTGKYQIAFSTLNPGNIGNDDAGNTNYYLSWDAGVQGVANWLKNHPTKK